MVASIAQPKVPDFSAAPAFGEFRVFRRHHQFAALRAGWPSEVPFVEETHRRSDLERHDESLRARWDLFTDPLCHPDAVSYTHLDVYKRQVEYGRAILYDNDLEITRRLPAQGLALHRQRSPD